MIETKMDACPFCRSESVAEAPVEIEGRKAGWCVSCADCGSSGPTKLTILEAATYWNRISGGPDRGGELCQSQDLDAEQRRKMEQARDLMFWASSLSPDDGCYCEDSNCTPANPQCGTRAEAVARELLREALEPRLIGRHPGRMTGAERIFVEVLREQNRRSQGINHGYTLLEHVLNPDLTLSPPRVSQHDAEIATTIVQFLGTNGGRCLIHDAERRIKAEDAEYRSFAHEARNLEVDEETDQMARTARMISRKHTAEGVGCWSLCGEILLSMKQAYAQGGLDQIEADQKAIQEAAEAVKA